MKRLILILIAIVLVITSVTTTFIVAQDDTLSEQSIRLENALNGHLRQALSNDLISRELAVRITDLWQEISEDEQLKLYQRVVNLIQSRQQQARLESAFYNALGDAITLGYIDRGKYSDIVNLWEQKTLEEQQQLYKRILNLLDLKTR
jgi:hypothetical protein